MGAARWVVIGTALVAAAVAFHLLLSPEEGRRAVSMPEQGLAPFQGADGTSPPSATGGSSGPGSASGTRATSGRPRPAGGPPQEELDAASRDAMRSFLRQSAQDEK